MNPAIPILIAVAAVVIAFAALWLSSTAIKKTEVQMTEFTNLVRNEFGLLRTSMDAKVKEMERMAVKLDNRVEQTKEVEVKAQKLFDEVSRDLEVLREIVTDLENGLPPEYRRRTHMSASRIDY